MTSYFERVVNESTYNQIARGSQPLDELNNVSSSAWDDRHLTACHVIVGSRNNKLLPRLKQIPRDDLEDDMRKQIDNFVNGLDEERQNQLENELVHDPEVGTSLAQIWDAFKPGYVDPGNVFTSSPPRSSQCDPPSSQTEGYVESMSPKGVVLEDYTVRLVFCILQHILYHCQNPDSSYVEVRERQRACASINGREVTAIDDGGLCLTSPGRNKTRKSIVLIEAKRRLEVSQDRVVVSDSVLGQMLCEAIAARISGQEECDDVFIINSTSYYMCFFNFEISETQLQEITRGKKPVKPIKVNATRWLNVKDARQRQHIARNIERLSGYLKRVSMV
ncbi:hypothetical protein HG530_014593 [Fusarium avenaceum]|nr:hypothetical protein HG530_014593 [Fusarium avenaceum]